MMSCKGFLSPDPNGRPRMTVKQRQAVDQAVQAAMAPRPDIFAGSTDDKVRELALDVVLAWLRNYPADRSCHTCDHFHGLACRHWQQEVPVDALEAGCNMHWSQIP